jgi:hypothetical protein
MADMRPEGPTAVVGVDAPNAVRRKTKIVVKTPAAAGPAKVVVSVARARHHHRRRRRGWLAWFRSIFDGIVTFVKSLVPFLTVVA